MMLSDLDWKPSQKYLGEGAKFALLPGQNYYGMWHRGDGTYAAYWGDGREWSNLTPLLAQAVLHELTGSAG